MKDLNKREFVRASAGLGLAGWCAAFAQQGSTPPATGGEQPQRRPAKRMAKTTRLFKSPPGHPNGIAASPDGLWISDQKLSGDQAAAYHMAEPKDLSENAWLVNVAWGILSTPVIDEAAGILYACAWISADGTAAR